VYAQIVDTQTINLTGIHIMNVHSVEAIVMLSLIYGEKIMSRRMKSIIIVLCWMLMMVAGNLVYLVPNGEGFVYLVYAIALLSVGKKLELWMEKILDY